MHLISDPIAAIVKAAIRNVAIGMLAWFLLGMTCRAAVTIHFGQNGNDTIVTSTGYLDLSGLEWSWSAWELSDAYYRQIGANLPQDLVRLYRTSVSAYEFPGGAELFSKQLPVLVADAYSGVTFGIWANASMISLYVPRYFKSGVLESSMTFRNLDLKSLGLIEQVIELGDSGDQRIIITSVPETGTLGITAAALISLVVRRRR